MTETPSIADVKAQRDSILGATPQERVLCQVIVYQSLNGLLKLLAILVEKRF